MCIFSPYLFRYDFLKIYDGDETSGTTAPSLGSFTGGLPTTKPQSTGRDMYLNFLSDFSVTFEGFELRFDAGKDIYKCIISIYLIITVF